MYGSFNRVQAQNHKAKLADSYNQLLQQLSDNNNVASIGNYAISKQIGEGSFGKVYLGHHKFVKSRVVLKSTTKDHPHLVRELHHHRLFKHPHIAQLYEIIVTESLVWMVMEYCPGDELYSYLIKDGRLKLEEAKKMFSQLAGAVAYTHARNCAHRDLKLENILLDKHRNVKLCDFGFTREYNPRALLETVCGTCCYMAPEMLMHKKYSGEAIDVWSLGVILYTLIYGEMPFEEENDIDTKKKVINEDPRYPDHIEVPGAAIDLMQKMLTKDAKARISLDEILNHPFLEEYAGKQKDILSEKAHKPLSTKIEKKLMRKLRSCHVNADELVDSIVNNRCDPLAGYWALALEREEKIQSRRRAHRASLSITKYSIRRESKADHHRPGSSRSNSATMDNNAQTRLSPRLRNLAVRDVSYDAEAEEYSEDGATRPTSEVITPTKPMFPSKLSNEITHHSPQDTIPDSPHGGLKMENLAQTDGKLSNSPSTKSSMSSVLAKTNEKTKEFGNTFKHVMLKFILPAKRRSLKKSHTFQNPQQLQQQQQHQQGSPGPQSMAINPANGDKLGDIQHHQDPFDELVPTIPLTTRPRSLGTPPPQRPVSQISQFSQLSQYSSYSMASQISSAPSNISQEIVTRSDSTSAKRPRYNRRSTSSSFSSILSRNHRDRAHSKTSSTSSASLNSSPHGPRSSAGSPTVNNFSIASPFNHRRHHSGAKGRFNETAVFSSRLRRKSPFDLGERSASYTHRGPATSSSKRSVIEEDEEEPEPLAFDEEEDRGRTM
ncbi:putative serine/threonine-protein kinase YPL150W [Trichomonascus vanleenenianus]|uniref:non-specific serine/threonine protein kinase n=1 Tax=Trichomonascus vanleenenianus TaxID=2268995 RepID=UPI003ECAB317